MGGILLSRLTVTAVLCGLLSASPALAGSACFNAEEAKAGHLRTLQQEFNVAALNCQSSDPNDPTPSIHDRYNSFVSKFGGKLSENAHAVRAHFQRAGGNLDNWMTRVANDAGQRVMSDPDYCQRASDNLDKALALQPHELDSFATTAIGYDRYVEECPGPKQAPAPTKKKSKHAVKTAEQ